MIDPNQLRDFVINPVLKILDLLNDRPPKGRGTIELLLGTAMQESELGVWLHQISGPAIGIWQIEPATARDLLNWLRAGHTELYQTLLTLSAQNFDLDEQMAGNLYFACAMARLYYWRIPEPLPAAGDIEGQWQYYKKYYNTPAGAATRTQYMQGFARMPLKWS